MNFRNAVSRGSIFAVVLLVAAVGVTSVAMSNTVFGDADNEEYVGTRDRGATIAEASPTKSGHGNSATWGVFAYESDRGLTCVQAGIVRDGSAGAYTRDGFRPFSPRDSVGNCGDLKETLSRMGGAAYGASAPATTEISDRTDVVYGLLSDAVSGVNVTLDDSSENVPVELSRVSGLGGATRAFVAPLPASTSLPGATVTFEFKNGETAVSRL